MELNLSKLRKTWLIDIDGTIVKHNGYKENGEDQLLEGIDHLFSNISSNDTVIMLTARKRCYKEQTENFLKSNNIRFDYVIYDLPHGERILINDRKASGLKTAFAVNGIRDEALNLIVREDESL